MTTRAGLAALAVCLIAPLAASAADLKNRDDVDYEVRIHEVATTHSSIEGYTTRLSICSECRIEVVGVGEIEVDPSIDAVVIENGELRTE
jgi:hypothetical protein